jgi:hypothetical protein
MPCVSSPYGVTLEKSASYQCDIGHKECLIMIFAVERKITILQIIDGHLP